jgi:hypothetical protein
MINEPNGDHTMHKGHGSVELENFLEYQPTDHSNGAQNIAKPSQLSGESSFL